MPVRATRYPSDCASGHACAHATTTTALTTMRRNIGLLQSANVFALRFVLERTEFARRLAMVRRGLVRRGDPEQHRLVERTRNEVDANRQARGNGPDQSCRG